MGKKIDSYSIDYSANWISNTTTNGKYDQTDGKDHPDYGIPLHIPQDEPDFGIPFNYIPENEKIVITSDAVFIKSLNLVIMTEDNYNKLKEKENEKNKNNIP